MDATEEAPATEAGPGGGLDLRNCRTDAATAMRALLEVLPVTLAVREIMRMRALADLGVLRMPMLDVGCGDGLFWEVAVRDLKSGHSNLDGLVGIDIDEHELRLATARLSPIGGDMRLIDISDPSMTTDLEGAKGSFETIIANCSLEHVPRLEDALLNIKQFLAPDGELLLFVPEPRWTDSFTSKRVLARISPRPLLVVQDGRDRIPAGHVRDLYAAAGEPKQYFVAPNAVHVGAFFQDFQGYTRTVGTFLTQFEL